MPSAVLRSGRSVQRLAHAVLMRMKVQGTFVTFEPGKSNRAEATSVVSSWKIPFKQTIRAKERRQMDQIVHGCMSQPHLNLSRKIELQEAAAQLETLRELANAIRQHRQILERRHDRVAKMD
jgi:hypothetical protein